MNHSIYLFAEIISDEAKSEEKDFYVLIDADDVVYNMTRDNQYFVDEII